MPAGFDAAECRRDVSPKNGRSRSASVGKIRILFGTTGWPSGVLEVASWAEHDGLAAAVIFQLQPGYAFRLDPEDRDYLVQGRVHPQLIDTFTRRGRPLSDDARVMEIDDHVWEIHDRRRGWTYRVAETAEGLDVTIVENVEAPEFKTAVRRFAERKSLVEKFFQADGLWTAAAHEALLAVGGQFVKKLIEFDPHVVGFRLEGGQLEEVKKFILAVRLFSNAQIVLGGPTATSHPQDVLEDSGADYLFAGEAEEPFNQFLRLAWERNSRDRLPEIPGVAYHYGDRVCQNTLPGDGYRRTVIDVDRSICGLSLRSLRHAVRPVADTELIAANRLDWSLLEGFDREFDSLFFTGGRGCPGACTFCAKLHGQEVRAKSARQLLEEIEAADAQVAAGKIKVTRWDLFKHVDDPLLKNRRVSWAAIYDEDFFLHRNRAIEFFRLWDQSLSKERYRISLQTNPCSLLTSQGEIHGELLRWIDRLKPMVQLGGESFHPELLARWRKRHDLQQLNTVLDALDRTRQDYTVFQLLTDFDTTPEELVETLRLLILNAYRRRRMRIASSPFTIPLYDSETREVLEYRGRLGAEQIGHFTDYERPQPGWMDPLAAGLADLADAQLQWTLNPEQRDAALVAAMEVVVGRIREEARAVEHDSHPAGQRKSRIDDLLDQASSALNEVRDARFQGIEPLVDY